MNLNKIKPISTKTELLAEEKMRLVCIDCAALTTHGVHLLKFVKWNAVYLHL